MALTSDVKVVVKHTFIEFVAEDGSPSSYAQPQRQRSQTHAADFELSCRDESTWGMGDDSTQASQGDASSYVPDTPEASPLLAPSVLHQPPLFQLEDSMLEMTHTTPCGASNFTWNKNEYGAWWLPAPATDPRDFYSGWMTHWPNEHHRSSSPASQSTATSARVDETLGVEWRTTVMMKDLPESYERVDLLNLLVREGFFGRFDFAYLPIDFKSQNNLGYALINMVTTAEAVRFFKHFEGFSNWGVPSMKTSYVLWCDPHQGLEAQVERYRNSPVMHESIPADWQPLLLSCGAPVAFPSPTKYIKAPKIKAVKK